MKKSTPKKRGAAAGGRASAPAAEAGAGAGGTAGGDVAYGRSVIEAEVRALQQMAPLLDAAFAAAVRLLQGCKGRIVVTGVGKSGLVGQKVSATLASTGTPSLFLHAAEAVHGDLGRVLRGDLVLALSYSGSTEVVKLVPVIKKIGAKLVSVTRGHDTPLAKVADVSLATGNVEEACPIGLAPTSSTTAMLALCDALAMTVARRKRFKREDFALFHPGGSLGRKLVRVGEVMTPIERVATVPPGATVGDALRRMNLPGGKRSAGAVLVTAPGGALLGLFTQGDFARRALEDRDATSRKIDDVMTRAPRVVSPDDLLADAYRLLERHRFDEVPVVDAKGAAVGMLDVNDVLEWGIAF